MARPFTTPRELAVLVEYVNELVEMQLRKPRLFNALRAKGFMVNNYKGDDIRWRVKVGQKTPTAITGVLPNVPFDTIARHKTAVLDFRGYGMGEPILKIEKLKNSAKIRYPQIVDDSMQDAVTDFEQFLASSIFADGGASDQNMHGLESFCGVSGQVTGRPVMQPNDSYAGMSTVLGAYGGTISGTFPDGKFTPEYAFWSPLVVKYNDSYFGSSPTWENSWTKALRYAQTWLRSNWGAEPDLVAMHPDMERIARDSKDATQRIIVTPKSQVVDFGIQTTNFEGLEILADPYCPVDTAYVLDSSQIKLINLQSKLVDVHQSEDQFGNTLYYLDFYGNYRVWTPAKVAKLYSV